MFADNSEADVIIMSLGYAKVRRLSYDFFSVVLVSVPTLPLI